jgi:3',5'-cyclic AMP phosphodiesterase CpdA
MNIFYKIIATILAFFIYLPTGNIAEYSPKGENPELVFSVLSDVHMEGNNIERFNIFGEGIRDVNSATRNDALVFLGDNTMNGQNIEHTFFYGLLDRYNSIENVLVTSGNHDLCPSEQNSGDYNSQANQFISFYNTFINEDIEKAYYSREINGYKFIVLASESDAGVQQYISAEQLLWLESELKSAESLGKPVFIFNHYPLNHTWPFVWTEGHIGLESEALHLLMKKCNNQIVYFSGHLHMGLYNNELSYINEDNITYISVPAFGADNKVGNADIQDKGMGLYVEAYEDEIIVRMRNYVEHEWMDIELSIPVK